MVLQFRIWRLATQKKDIATWDREKVQHVFISFDAEVILSIPLCTRQLSDFLSWNYDKGVFFY